MGVTSLIGQGIIYFLSIIRYAILFRVALSFFVSPFSGIMRMMITLTEPFIAPVRGVLSRFMNTRAIGVDFSPLISMVLLSVFIRIVAGIF